MEDNTETEVTIDRDHPVWGDVFELASVAARRIERRWWRWARFDDLRSAALEYAVRRPDLVSKFLLEREDEKERRRGEHAFVTVLSRAAERHARKEKAEQSGYKVEDEFFYTRVLLEGMIKILVSGDYAETNQTVDPETMGGRRAPKAPNEGNNLLAMMADVQSALDTLEIRDRAILMARFGEDKAVKDVADAWGISPGRVSQIEERALRKMGEALGGRKP